MRDGWWLVLALGAALAQPHWAAAQQLGPFDIVTDRVFVAGISSGGYMAVQMHVAYSGLFKGAAIYAGGPDYCAQDSLAVALTTCTAGVPPVDPAPLVATTEAWSQAGSIDPVRNLHAQPVYLWSGRLDTTVRQPVMNALATYYRALGADVFRYDNDFFAEHGWESPDGPLPCTAAASPYVIACYRGYQQVGGPAPGSPGYGTAYDSEQVWLRRWLGALRPKNEGALRGQLVAFDQNRFAPAGNAAAISMDGIGYAFIPQECADGRPCSLVMALHGCQQSHGAVGTAFIQGAGLNRWADTNRVVVLYPQAIATAATGSNPQGCWDWWGYLNDPDYAQKSGPQMQTLRRMVEQAMAGGRHR